MTQTWPRGHKDEESQTIDVGLESDELKDQKVDSSAQTVIHGRDFVKMLASINLKQRALQYLLANLRTLTAAVEDAMRG